ncbi:hypothetical protein, partial [Escherichia coli]|uniref:hypothetical protein n=1 Tax=Escherichia coli TaxID=562 RepID=UPI0019D0FD5A
LRDEWSHFLPESITDLPLVARHTSPSEIIILYYLTIPFGIGSKSTAMLPYARGREEDVSDNPFYFRSYLMEIWNV